MLPKGENDKLYVSAGVVLLKKKKKKVRWNLFLPRNCTKGASIHVMHIVVKRFHWYIYGAPKNVSG